MFDYTKAAIKKTVDDFKRVDLIRNLATQILYIAYLIYALCTGAGHLWANIPLLTLSVAYFVFFILMTRGETSKKKKQTKTIVKRIFTRCKQFIKLLTLGVMVYGICITTKQVTPIAVLLAAMMIVGWILQIIFEVILRIFIGRAHFILEGMEADYENAVKPAKTVGNFFKKLTGQKVETEQERSKNKKWLDKKVAENKAEIKAKKRAERLAQKQARIDAKNTVFLPSANEENVLPSELEPEKTPVFEEISPALALSEPKRKKKFKKEDRS